MARPSREQTAEKAAAKQAEFNAAVEAKVQEQMAGMESRMLEALAARLEAARTEAGTAGGNTALSDRAMLSELVTGIAKLSDPHNQKRIVSPEELARREDARNAMTTLLINAHARNETPIYYLTAPVYLAEILIQPQYRDPVTKQMLDRHIEWPQVPNEAMVPVNDLAKKVHEQFMISIGGKSRNENVLSSFVRDRNEIFARRPETPETGGADLRDPRNMGGFAPGRADFASKQQKQVIRILGTVAPAAEVQP